MRKKHEDLHLFLESLDVLVVFRLELDVVSGHGVGVGSETLGEDRGETPSLVDRLEGRFE